MTIRHSLLLIVSLLSFLATPAMASDGPGTKTVRDANSKLSAMLQSGAGSQTDEKAQLQQARSKLGGFLDIEELGKLALKDHWQGLSPEKQKEFTTLLRDLIETNYLKGLRANVKYKVKYLGEESQGKFLLVHTIVQSKRRGRPVKIEIDYLLSKQGKSWRTFDIKTDGIGLVENYRAMFNKIIAKSGFDALLSKMRKKLAKLK